jgi:hypothetical protein
MTLDLMRRHRQLMLPTVVDKGQIVLTTARRGSKRRHATLAKKARAEAEYRFIRKYGLTAEQVRALIATQNRRCAICDAPFEPKPCLMGLACVVDHLPGSKVVRGILCHPCNIAIGLLRDDVTIVSKALGYLTQRGSAPGGAR